ncbi:hypothetical protein Tco_0502635 [Tanacetum coccineum]
MPAEAPATNVLSTVVIVPPADPSVSVEDYDNPDSADVVPENAILGSKGEGKNDATCWSSFQPIFAFFPQAVLLFPPSPKALFARSTNHLLAVFSQRRSIGDAQVSHTNLKWIVSELLSILI